MTIIATLHPTRMRREFAKTRGTIDTMATFKTSFGYEFDTVNRAYKRVMASLEEHFTVVVWESERAAGVPMVVCLVDAGGETVGIAFVDSKQ